MRKSSLFWYQKSKKFLGRGTTPSPDSTPSGEGDTPSPHPLGASTPVLHFLHQYYIFWGRGTAPSRDPNLQWGGGHSLPTPHTPSAPSILAPSALDLGASILPPVQWQILLILCPSLNTNYNYNWQNLSKQQRSCQRDWQPTRRLV